MTEREYEELIRSLVNQLFVSDYRFTEVYGIVRGGLIPAVSIGRAFARPVYWAYDARSIALRVHRLSLVVDDVADTGETLGPLPDWCTVAVLVVKPHCSVKPNFYAMRTKKWVVFPYEKKEELPWAKRKRRS